MMIQKLPEAKEVNDFLKNILTFGKIQLFNNKFIKFKESPKDINNKLIYTITGENKNILTKIETQNWIGILSENIFEKPKLYKWKIKILKNQSKWIRVGIVPKDYDISKSSNYSCGWCFYNFYPALYSGPPHYYDMKETNLNHIKEEIVIVANTEKGTIKFIVDKVDKGDSFNNIPFEQPFVPVVFLYSSNYSVEVTMID